MLRYVVAALCGLSLTGSVYMAGWGGNTCPISGGDCCDAPPAAALMNVSATAPSSAGKIEVKNTKCIVSAGDIEGMGGAKTVEYKGKVYNLCCSDCIEPFNKDPEKYVKALEADPKKFGLMK